MKRKFAFPTKHPSAYTMPDGTVRLIGSRKGAEVQHCFLDKKQFDDLVQQFGEQGALKLKAESERIELALDQKYKKLEEGSMSKADFDAFKQKEIIELNTKVSEIEKLTKVVNEQGLKINDLLQPAKNNKVISFEQFLKQKVKLTKEDGTDGEEVVILDKMKEIFNTRTGVLRISAEDMRKAGVRGFAHKAAASTTIANSVQAMDAPPSSPYLPGIGGADLELFDIVRNPNFIINHVDVGSTNQARLAWVNETDYQGTPGTTIAEAGTKALTQHKFKVEFSQAKKAAAYIILSEEFDQDLPGLSTSVRRMLGNDVMRAFDDQIQTDLLAVARPYEIDGLDGEVDFANLWDAIGAELAQVGFNNFISNTIALNSVTNWNVGMQKDSEGRYLVPPFMQRIQGMLVEANKLAVGHGLVGDLSQYKVDIYKEFSLVIGWINDQLITNQFTIVGEMRYHSYISDNRKKAIVYDVLTDIRDQISSGS